MPDPGLDPLPRGWNETRPPRWLPRAVLYGAIGIAGFLIAQYLFVKLSDLLTILLVSLFLSLRSSRRSTTWRSGDGDAAPRRASCS